MFTLIMPEIMFLFKELQLEPNAVHGVRGHLEDSVKGKLRINQEEEIAPVCKARPPH